MNVSDPQGLLFEGEVFKMTSCSYEDYHVKGLFKATEDMSMPALIERFIDTITSPGYYYDPSDFVKWFRENAPVEELPFEELPEVWLGETGNIVREFKGSVERTLTDDEGGE